MRKIELLAEVSRLYVSWIRGQPPDVDTYINVASLSGIQPEYFLKQFEKGKKPYETT